MFVYGKPLQPSLMFAGKAGAYPSERLAGDKHSSLLQKSVYYGRKFFYSIGPGGKTDKTHFCAIETYE